jgi:lipopolysaccharide/colanic/teichoic acid biosynthesis glycosyltransferase
LDILLSSVGILVCAIPFLVIAIAIKLDSPGRVFYRQARVGKGGEVFQIIKFRTMSDNAERGTGPVWAAVKDPRLTRVGAFLRGMRLDELPNLFNVLKGDMGLVGPRPERPEFVYWFIQYMSAFDRRHDVKPGITGLAQLKNGYDTSAASVYRKLRWDVEYIKRKCLSLDLWIIYCTVFAVLRGKV